MPIVVAGFLALFLELSLIRWMASNMFVLAYFSNVVLVASFLGLGIGYLLADRRRDGFRWLPPLLLVVVAISAVFRFIQVFMAPSEQDLLWNLHYDGNWLRPLTLRIGIWPALAIAFVLSAAPFVLIGQKTALLMKGLPPLKAYALNIGGSLLGVCTFGALAFMGPTFGNPTVWFAVAGAAALWLLRGAGRKWLAVGVMCLMLTGVFPRVLPDQETWSPYYAINILYDESERLVRVFVNRFLHQVALHVDLTDDFQRSFSLAYQIKSPKKVLVLGAGTGNDVAVALANGAEEVHAVELDPLIAKIGVFHPDHPYADPRVHLIVDDARSYLRRTQEKYDLIVFGTLDSHALLSGMSTVRLENFVYTTDSFKEAAKHLTPDGIIAVLYSAPTQWVGDRIIKTVWSSVPGPAPLVFAGNGTFVFNLMVVAGPGLATVSPEIAEVVGFRTLMRSSVADKDMPTDDWPYLYLRSHAIPSHYLFALLLLALLSMGGLYAAVGRDMLNWGSRRNGGFFLLGAAFLLLETKSVTTLSLLFGSTWLVNAFVFAGILAMGLGANTWVTRRPPTRVEPWYAALGASLLLNFLIPASTFLSLPDGIRFLVPALLAALPLFFAAFVFSFHVKEVEDLPPVLGANIMGAVLGGLLEYASMLTGMRFLYILAVILYAGAFWMFRRRVK